MNRLVCTLILFFIYYLCYPQINEKDSGNVMIVKNVQPVKCTAINKSILYKQQDFKVTVTAKSLSLFNEKEEIINQTNATKVYPENYLDSTKKNQYSDSLPNGNIIQIKKKEIENDLLKGRQTVFVQDLYPLKISRQSNEKNISQMDLAQENILYPESNVIDTSSINTEKNKETLAVEKYDNLKVVTDVVPVKVTPISIRKKSFNKMTIDTMQSYKSKNVFEMKNSILSK